MMTNKRSFMARHLRTKNIPFSFEYLHFSCDVPGYEENVRFRHIWIEGSAFGIYITYTDDKPYYQIHTGYNELDFNFYPSKDKYLMLDFVLELRNDKRQLETYLLQLKEEREQTKREEDNLLQEFMKQRKFEEKVSMIKRWFNLTKEQRLLLQGDMFFDKRLKQIYVDFLLGKE